MLWLNNITIIIDVDVKEFSSDGKNDPKNSNKPISNLIKFCLTISGVLMDNL